MLLYLWWHYKITFLLFIVLFICSKIKILSNRMQLFLLYLLALRSVIPWGFIHVSGFKFSRAIKYLPYSFDNPVEPGSLPHVIRMNYFNEHYMTIAWCVIVTLLFSLLSVRMYLFSVKIKRDVSMPGRDILSLFYSLLNDGNIREKVSLVICSSVSTPCLWYRSGWLILLPKHCSTMSERNLKVILAHELMHIRKKDIYKYFLLYFAGVLFFFSPFLKLVLHEIQQREEIETDLLAMTVFSISPRHFGGSIVSFIKSSVKSTNAIPLCMFLKKFNNKRKIKMRLRSLFLKENSMHKINFRKTAIILSITIFLAGFDSNIQGRSSFIVSEMQNPLPSGYVTMRFGAALHPITNEKANHSGIDIAAPQGTPILAACSGVIAETGYDKGRGNFVILSHDNDIITVYSHLRESVKMEGKKIQAGEKVAYVGNTGFSTGPHLHFEIRKNNIPVDPETFIKFR